MPPTTNDAPKSLGIVLIDHGSRRAESNDQLLAVAEAYRRRVGWPIVEPAHMELAEPSLADAVRRCVEQGADLIVVFPYFLAPGKHWNEDIPRLATEASAPFAGVRCLVAEPLGLDERMLAIIDDRIAGALAAESLERQYPS